MRTKSTVQESKEKIISAILGALDTAYAEQGILYMNVAKGLLKLSHRQLSDYLVLCYASRKLSVKAVKS